MRTIWSVALFSAWLGIAPAIQAAETGKTVVSFVDDDCINQTYYNWLPLAQEKGINISLAVSPTWIIGTGKPKDPTKTPMTEAQLQEMYDAGHECLSHGWDTNNTLSASMSAAQFETELKRSRDWLLLKGYTRNGCHNCWVYPQGLNGNAAEREQIKKWVGKYYSCGINACGAFFGNKAPDPYDIPRYYSDNKSLGEMKAEFDAANARKGWLIVLSHSYRAAKEGDAAWRRRYGDFIDYVKASGAVVLPFAEAKAGMERIP